MGRKLSESAYAAGVGQHRGSPPRPPPRPGQPWEGAAELQGFLTCLQLNCSLPQQV